MTRDPSERLHFASDDLPSAFRRMPGSAADAAEAAEAERKKAYDEGFAAGEAAAREELAGQLDRAAHQVGQTLERLATDHETWQATVQDQLMIAVRDLALAAAERLLRARVEADDEVAARVLKDVLVSLGELPPLALRAHPADMDSLKATLGERGSKTLKWIEDESIDRGGFLVDTAQGGVDARVPTALAALADALGGEE